VEIENANHERAVEVFGPGQVHICECEFCGDDSPMMINTHPVVSGRTQRHESYLVCRGCLPRLATGTLDKERVRRSAGVGGDTERELLLPAAVFLL